jgi:hypothetical protein
MMSAAVVNGINIMARYVKKNFFTLSLTQFEHSRQCRYAVGELNESRMPAIGVIDWPAGHSQRIKSMIQRESPDPSAFP